MSIPANEAKFIAPDTTESCALSRTRKPYAKPVLEPLGDIRDLTLAGSLGAGESGKGMATRKP